MDSTSKGLDMFSDVNDPHRTISFVATSPAEEPSRTCRFVAQPPIPPKNPPGSDSALWIRANDFDGDHLVDLLYVRAFTPVIEVFLRYSNHSFETHQEYAIEAFEDEKILIELLFIVDLNHDHHFDLI